MNPNLKRTLRFTIFILSSLLVSFGDANALMKISGLALNGGLIGYLIASVHHYEKRDEVKKPLHIYFKGGLRL